MMFFNTYEENIPYEHAIFEPSEEEKLKQEVYGLKLENKTLKIEAIEK